MGEEAVGRTGRSSGDHAWWGTPWGVRVLTVRTTRPAEVDGELALGDYEILRQADVLTNIGGIHALTAWRLYNKGAVVGSGGGGWSRGPVVWRSLLGTWRVHPGALDDLGLTRSAGERSRRPNRHGSPHAGPLALPAIALLTPILPPTPRHRLPPPPPLLDHPPVLTRDLQRSDHRIHRVL